MIEEQCDVLEAVTIVIVFRESYPVGRQSNKVSNHPNLLFFVFFFQALNQEFLFLLQSRTGTAAVNFDTRCI